MKLYRYICTQCNVGFFEQCDVDEHGTVHLKCGGCGTCISMRIERLKHWWEFWK